MGTRLDNARGIYLEGILDGDVEAIHRYAGNRYTQHSTPVRDGTAGFIEFFTHFLERNPVRDIRIIRGFEDGNHVFLQAFQDLNDGEFQYVTADIFDTDDSGKLIEHWDIIEELRAPTAGERTQIDGPTEPTDLHLTNENKQLVVRYLNEILVGGGLDRIGGFVAEDVAQHHPDVADGLDAYREHLDTTAQRYVEVHKVVGSGSLVAALVERELDGAAHATIDLFRIADGRIAEMWLVDEAITPRDSWVNSGKF